MSALISVEGATLSRGDVTILRALSLSINPGEVVILLGPSGAGKSTLLRAILGLEQLDGGVIRLRGEVATRGQEILLLPEERRLSVVFQDLALWPHLTVYENLAFGLKARGVSLQEREQQISKMLARVELQGKEGRYPKELSGGEQQRVAIARALVLSPDALLLDEPLAHLDAMTRREISSLLGSLIAEQKMAALYVTHHLSEVARLGGRLVILDEGRLLFSGTLEELRAAPKNKFIEALFTETP